MAYTVTTIDQNADIRSQATGIVVAYVSNNPIPVGDLPTLIHQVYNSLANIENGAEVPKERPEPAVPIKKSITDDYLICLEDGKQMRMLKRHLATKYGMTPEEYRERWGLRPDYPMTAPNYTARRSRIAREIGLGLKRA